MANDEILVKQAMTGDKDAFGQLVQIYQGAVYGLCYHIVGNFADAQDLAQEAFVQSYQDLHQLREPAKFANWLNRVTRNICGMWLRRRNSKIIPLDEVALGDFANPATSTPLEEIEAEEMHQFVRRAIDALSEKNQLTVTLFYMDGLSYQKIGDFLGVPVSTVKSRLHESRKQLKEELIKMVEKTFEKHKLPQDFADKVLHEVSVNRMTYDEKSNMPIVFLANKAMELQNLPIWIGQSEGHAIHNALERQEFPRPMTHDLFINVMREYGIKMTAAIVAEIRGTTFHGRLILESGGVIKEIDSRPSDAIALALRANAPIFVEQSVFHQSGSWFTAFEAGKLPEEFSKELKGFSQSHLIQKYQEKLRELEASPDEHAEMINLLHWDLAEYCRREGMNDDAARSFERALERCDNDSQRVYIYRCIGWNYFNVEMYDKAIPAFQKSVEIFPSNIDVLYGLGMSYGRRKMWDEAIPQFQKVLQIDERHTDARGWIADRYFMTENYEQAKTEFQKCIEFRPDWGYARARLSDLYEMLGQPDEALETLKKAIAECNKFERWGPFTVYMLEKVEKLYRQLGVEIEFVQFCRDAIAEKMRKIKVDAKAEGVFVRRVGEGIVVMPPEEQQRRISMAAQMDWWLGEYFQRKGDTEAAQAQFEKLGLIQEDAWHVIGPFDNSGNKGFLTEYPPEREIDFEKSYQGLSGEVKWTKAQGGRSKSCVDFAHIFGVKEWATAYAYTTISSEKEKDAQLRIGSKWSVVVWLNNEPIFRQSIGRISAPDQDVIPVKLKAGENKLLIKSCVGHATSFFGEIPTGWELSADWCIFARIVEL